MCVCMYMHIYNDDTTEDNTKHSNTYSNHTTMPCEVLCRPRRPLIAGCLPLWRLGLDLAVPRPVGIKPQTSCIGEPIL